MQYRQTKDVDWNIRGELKDGYLTGVPAEDERLSVLMDIRHELRRLNNVLACPNFLAIPSKLDCIVRNTTKPRRKRRRTIAT